MRSLSALVFFLGLVPPCLAQSTCDRQIAVNVRGPKGDFVSDLNASSFHAKLAKQDAAVTSAGVFTGSIRLILLLDASGSMAADRDMARWKAIKSFTEQLVIAAPASTKLAIAVFNTQIVREVGFNHSRRELLASIEQAPDAKGHTSLWNSLLEASQMFGDPAPGDAVLVISDFGDTAGKASPAEVRRTFTGKGVRIFGIGIFDHYFSSLEEREGVDEFLALVKQTGGDVIMDIGKHRGNEAGLLRQVFDELGKFYVLKITPTVPVLKPERLNLSLLPEKGKKNKGMVLYYPQQLAPCAP